tara:strand:+ start:850 stop:1320 length:471 start_codon:yes stop_codon:yes gene_type:complete
MPSQIKVDEIKNVAGQYKIKTNVLEGQTTAGSIVVQGEGTATTNLQQGLAKATFSFDGTAGTVSLGDGHNVGSITDNATGNYTLNYTNNMGSINFMANTLCCKASNQIAHMFYDNASSYKATTYVQFKTLYHSNNTGGGAAVDCDFVEGTVHGDLA